ncbi:hypothetical protein PGB90_010588 [Kerria lacca]
MSSFEEILPTFVTIGTRWKIETMDTIVLPCEVSNLGIYVLAWKRGNAILTAGPTKVSPDKRIRLLDGYNLEIREVQTTDAGDYICHIATLQPKEITHTLEVLVSPHIHPLKSGGVMEVRKGDPVTLDCNASGNPIPNITWTRKNDVLPLGEKSFSGSSYTIKQTTRHNSGIYICIANNGVKPAAVEQIILKVSYAPEIQAEKHWVHSGENEEAELVCIVNAEPAAEVLWYRNTLQLDVTERRITENRGSRHTLIIRKVESDDFGNYSCVADNAVGKSRQDLILSGKPLPAIVSGYSKGKFKDNYNITWVVGSYTPIDDYKLSYKIVSDIPQTYPQVSYSNRKFNKSNLKGNEMIYSNEIEGLRSRWKNITLTASSIERFNHTMSYHIQDLEPDTKYEVIVYSKNRFGWSEPSEPFLFETKGTEPEMRDMGVKSMNDAIQIQNNLYRSSKIVAALIIKLSNSTDINEVTSEFVNK